MRHLTTQSDRLRSIARAVVCTVGLLSLAACGGGGGGSTTSSNNSGGGSSGSTGTNVPCDLSATGRDWSDCSYAGNFDLGKSNTIRNSAEYRFADASFTNPTSLVNTLRSPGYGTFTGTSQSNPYNLIHLDVALGSGLTGNGQVVAILDNGFRLDHQELVGQVAGSYGTIGTADHGTHVASIIAGKMDGQGMHGVAPGAKLFLSDWAHGDGGSSVDLQWMAGAVTAAANFGAIAHNNSWGWSGDATVNAVKAAKNSSNGYEDALSSVIGFAPGDWLAYINALDYFQQSGVVVFASSNNEGLTGSDVASSMPIFFPQLSEAWIKAINGYYEVDGSGNITYAQRLSSPCAEMAKMCIAGDGTTYAAESYANDDYWAGTGTSYVAPQISGAVALVAEAFPALSPAELTDRLLASADNSWFGRLNVPVNGTVNFGNGVSHSYSNEWGMGTLDLAAALAPIGSLVVTSGGNVNTADRTTLSDATISTSAAFGDGLSAALDGFDMAVFDSLNADFHINAGDLVTTGGDSLLPRMLKADSAASDGESGAQDASFADSLEFTAFGSDNRTGSIRMGYSNDVGGFAGAETAKGALGDSTVLALAEGAFVARADRQFGKFGFTAHAFTGGHAGVDDGSISGVGATLSFATGTGELNLGINQVAEHGALLGLESSSSFNFGDGGNITSVDFGFEQPITSRLSLFAGAEYGLASATGLTGTGLVDGVDQIAFSGFSIGASLSKVVTATDKLTLTAAQPLRVESGTTTMTLPVGRDRDGNILYQAVDANLAPSGREIDLSLAYDLAIQDSANLKLGLSYAIDAGHVSGAQDLGLSAFYRLGF